MFYPECRIFSSLYECVKYFLLTFCGARTEVLHTGVFVTQYRTDDMVESVLYHNVTILLSTKVVIKYRKSIDGMDIMCKFAYNKNYLCQK